MNVKFRQQDKYIRCSFQYNLKRVTMIVQNIRVNKTDFSKQKQRFKPASTNAFEYNEVLNKYENTIKKLYANIINFDSIPDSTTFKQMVIDDIKGLSHSQKSFKEFLNYFIENSKNDKSDATIRQYESSIKTFKEFEKHLGVELQFSSFNMELYDSLISYYRNEKGYANNTIGNRIKHLKSILNFAHKRGYIKDRIFDSYTKPSSPTDDVYLTFEEYDEILKLKLENKREDIIRDLFLIGCDTGLRFEDYSSLKKDNFQNGILSLVTRKTKHRVTIPISPLVHKILNKYNGDLPNFNSNPIFNKKIKEICKRAGIDAMTTLKKDINGSIVDVSKPKYKWVSSHTARRSFATNYYMETEAHTYDIMSITGHKTESQFLNYIQKNKKEPMKSLALAMKKRFEKF